MPTREGVSGRLAEPPAVNARLLQAAMSGETLEVILVLRGRVRQAGGDRWRIRVDSRSMLTFRAGAVIAATAVSPDRKRR
jgi:hypothetical protein